MRLRTAAKAIVIHEGRLLVIRKADEADSFYTLPGGGQKPGETLVEALKREVAEETGAEVEPVRLRCVREYIGRNHEFPDKHADQHQVDFCFDCRLVRQPHESRRTHQDRAQVDVEWLDLDRLDTYPLWPRVLRTQPGTGPVYLGDVN